MKEAVIDIRTLEVIFNDQKTELEIGPVNIYAHVVKKSLWT